MRPRGVTDIPTVEGRRDVDQEEPVEGDTTVEVWEEPGDWGDPGGAERSTDQGNIYGLEAQGKAAASRDWGGDGGLADQGNDRGSEDDGEARRKEEPGGPEGVEGRGTVRDPEVCAGGRAMTDRGWAGGTREPEAS